ncbi:beta-1,6-glucan boisynthesis protein [Aspergillus uvarum CBS 121591]|uniref:Beta-1,6-glucan boisynthesis protein n=1 Tax=Aspergillus uvarum CBS 121591 TaxID=1448315 RepID=A0A319BW92_9EURO|nr:beta-1,6-glucan boisynthesis protein [Aspergillus uvarum CBS 121591]PYH76954.1 beta-1,6-glucan boisynthesis protein [Aspergillus uvarum CBS 121591]
MMVRHLILFLLAALFPQALADVEFVIPKSGAVLQIGDVLMAQWRESGRLPPITDLLHYDLYLCAGGEVAGTYEDVALLSKGNVFARGNSISFTLDPSLRETDANTYFLKIVSWGTGASVINVSEQFTITNMTGPVSTSVSHSLPPTINDSALSDYEMSRHHELRKRQVEEALTVPYQLQTGPTRYAPMAKKPASTIPAKLPTPQFAASAYTIATTYLPPATVQVTLSASVTYSVASIENTASPAPHLHDAQMKRFLERWKD